MPIITTKISRFDGGITNNIRDTRVGLLRSNANFDALTNPHKLSPYRANTVSADGSATTSKKRIFALGANDLVSNPNTYQLYAFGVQSGTDKAEVLKKDISVGVTGTDFDDSTWGSPTANQSSAGTAFFDCFVYYKSTATAGKFYGYELNSGSGTTANRIFAFDPQGSAWSSAEGTLTISATKMAQGLVHSKDNVLYMPYENYIASKNGAGAFNMSALILPQEMYITSLAEYGNYLAIACAQRSGYGNSRLFLWDRDSTVNTLAESIDLGSGVIKIIEQIDGVLIAISVKAESNPAITGTQSAITKQKVFFRALQGTVMVKLLELNGEGTDTAIPLGKQKLDNRIYFQMSITFNGSQKEGVWSFGRSSPGSPFALFHEQTTELSSSTLYNFIFVGDFLFYSVLTNGSVHITTRTSTATTYLTPSTYESVLFDLGDPSITKKLVEVTVFTEYLPSGGQTLVKYRKDSDTSWTLISTGTSANSQYHSAKNIESTGANLPTFKEIQFRIESTGGAEITGFSFDSEIVGKLANP